MSTVKASKAIANAATARVMERLWQTRGEQLPTVLEQGIQTIDRLARGETPSYQFGHSVDLVNLLTLRFGLVSRLGWARAKAKGDPLPQATNEPTPAELTEQALAVLRHSASDRLVRAFRAAASRKADLETKARADLNTRYGAYGATSLFISSLRDHEDRIEQLERETGVLAEDAKRFSEAGSSITNQFRAAAAGLVDEVGAEAIARGIVAVRNLEDKSEVDPAVLAELKRQLTEGERGLTQVNPSVRESVLRGLKTEYAARVKFEHDQMESVRQARTQTTVRRIVTEEVTKAAGCPTAWNNLAALVEANPDKFPADLPDRMLAVVRDSVDHLSGDDIVEALTHA